jgi:hypothetical protein
LLDTVAMSRNADARGLIGLGKPCSDGATSISDVIPTDLPSADLRAAWSTLAVADSE